MAQLNLDLTNYEADEAFDALPPGWYEAKIIDSEIKISSAGNDYILWSFGILGKPNRVWMNTVLNNEIAMRILKTMAHCMGHKNPNFLQDSEELHGLSCMVKLVITKQEGYDDKNEIKAFKPLANTLKPQPTTILPGQPVQTNAPSNASKAQQPGVQQQPEASKPKMPWQ